MKKIHSHIQLNYRVYLIAGAAWAALMLGHSIIGQFIEEIIFPFTTPIKGTGQNSILMLLLAVCIARLNYSPKNIEYVLAWVVLTITYVCFRFSLYADSWEFYTLFNNGQFTFVCAFILALLPYYVVVYQIKTICKKRKTKDNNKKTPNCESTESGTTEIDKNIIWNEGAPIKVPDDDKYNFKDLAEKLSKKIVNQNNFTGSFCIAVKASWGNGKTSFMNLLRNNIKNENSEKDRQYIELDYNPWLTKSKEDYTQDLLHVIASKTTDLNRSLARLMRNYAQSLQVSSPKLLAFFNILGAFFHPKSREENYNKDRIKQHLKANNIQLFVYIDDVDRLVGEEIINFLKVLRGATDFPNTFFIVGIDHDYLVESLLKHNIHDPNNYLKKFFQLEYGIPDSIVQPEKGQPDNSLIKIARELMKDILAPDYNDLYVNFPLVNKKVKEPNKTFSIEYALRILLNNKREQIQFSNLYNTLAHKNSVNKVALFWCSVVYFKYRKIWLELKFNPEFYLQNDKPKCVLRPRDKNSIELNIDQLIYGERYVDFYNISPSQQDNLRRIFLFLFCNSNFDVSVKDRDAVFALL